MKLIRYFVMLVILVMLSSFAYSVAPSGVATHSTMYADNIASKSSTTVNVNNRLDLKSDVCLGGDCITSWPEGGAEPSGDGVPIGTIAFFDGTECPAGWEEVTDARGRYLTGLPEGGALGALVGTALTNTENRAVGQHNHDITDSGHSHGMRYFAKNMLYGYDTFRSDLIGRNVWHDDGGSSHGTMSTSTGITINNEGSVAGTNAPYMQLLVCKKTSDGGTGGGTVGGGLGDWDNSRVIGAIYQADTDGVVLARTSAGVSGTDAQCAIQVFTDGNSNPSTLVGEATASKIGGIHYDMGDTVTVPVKKGDYWKAAWWPGSPANCAEGVDLKWISLEAGGSTVGADSDWTIDGGNMYSAVSGNIGVGISNPMNKLHVGGTIQSDAYIGLRLTDENAQIRFNGESGEKWSIGSTGVAGQDDLIFHDVAQGVRMTIDDTTGNVGIGTITPTSKLHVSGGISSTSLSTGGISASSFSVSRNDDQAASFTSRGRTLMIGTDGNMLGFIRLRPTSGNGVAITGDNDDIGVFVSADSGANVGIGTSGPSYKLHVVGSAYTTTSWQSSDIKFKENISPITSALDKLSEVRGVSFDWKTEEYPDKGFADGRHLGVIAQEVEKVFPEVVNDADGEKAVAYNELIPVLIEAVKELKEQNEDLKQRIIALENR